MPSIAVEEYFDGVENKIERLGLTAIMQELHDLLTDFRLEVKEERGANGGGALRKILDRQFANVDGWVKKTVGGIDHTKCSDRAGVRLCVGVEVQVSGRSDLVAVDLLHLKEALRGGLIDVGVLIVPTDELSSYLPSRFPSVSEARRILEAFEADSLPLVLWGIQHDGPGDPLPVRGR